MYSFTTATQKITNLKKRIRIIQGGTSASKTISILLWIVDRAQQTHEAKELFSIVSESIPHLKRGAMRDFKNIMQAHNYWRDSNWNATDSIYSFEGGSMVEFFSTDNGDKLRGSRRDWLFMNEANNCTFEAFEQLEVRTKKGIFIDYNPSNEFWAHTELIGKRDDVDFIILTYKDNEALDPAIREALEQRRNRKSWWKVYGEGQLGEVEGRIYTGWIVIDEVPEEAKLKIRGLDFGYSVDPSACVDIYEWNGALVIDQKFYQKGLLNSQIAQLLNDDCGVLTIGDSSEPKSIDEIKTYGISIVGAIKGPDSRRNGIAKVQEYKIFITKQSVETLKEYRNYLWAVDKEGKTISPPVPEDGNDHAMDAIRYAISRLKSNAAGEAQKLLPKNVLDLSKEDLHLTNLINEKYEIGEHQKIYF
jgi:phage terminase large subunit